MISRQRIIYSRGFPYGAPLVMLRGGGTKAAKETLKAAGFSWNGQRHAWEHYLNRPELTEVLLGLRSEGYEIIPKAGMDSSYVIELGDAASEEAGEVPN